MNEETFELLNFKLIEGRFPLNSNEIVISNHIINNANMKLKVGDKLKLDIGERKTLEGYDLKRQ